jgi:hypothetical protein
MMMLAFRVFLMAVVVAPSSNSRGSFLCKNIIDRRYSYRTAVLYSTISTTAYFAKSVILPLSRESLKRSFPVGVNALFTPFCIVGSAGRKGTVL